MKKILFDELSFILNDDEKEQFEEENGYNYDWVEESCIEFDSLFDNEHENKRYVVTGYLDLWDGIHKGHLTRVYYSLKEAIINCEVGFGCCRSEVVEEKYGRLYVITHHHDSIRGGNKMEIKELSKLGEILYDCDYPVEDILNRKGATRNVKYSKNYL